MFALPRTLRYLVFSLFIIFSAVIASVGVWNRSLAQDGQVGWSSNVDLYLIFLGCFGLVVIFAVIFTELAWRHGVSGRVWFECTWIGIFWLLYLTAAASLTVLFPARSCVVGFKRLTADACTSGRVLLGISWAMCVILFFYMSFLTFAALSHQHDDPDIWHSYVHKLSWKTQQRNLPSNPPTPSVPRFMPKMPALVAPKPKHLVPSQMYNTGRFGLGSEYEVEGYATPAPGARGPAGPLPPPGRLAAHSSLGLHIPSEPPGFGTSFYAHGVQSVLTPLEPVRPEGHRPQLPPAPPSPPPLGSWPRANPPADSIGRRRPVPPGLPKSNTQPQSIPLSGTSPPRERPLGPRRRSEQDGRTHQYSTSTSLQR